MEINKQETGTINNAKDTISSLLEYLDKYKREMYCLCYVHITDQLTRAYRDLASLKLKTEEE